MALDIKLKFGKNIENKKFVCSHCRNEFKNEPTVDNNSIYIVLSIKEAMQEFKIEFPICPNCVQNQALQGNVLFQTKGGIVPQYHDSYPVVLK